VRQARAGASGQQHRAGTPVIASACHRTSNTRHAAVGNFIPNAIAAFPNAITTKKFPG
jgi:hypothetical protein